MILADVITIPTWAAVAGSVLFLTTVGASVATMWASFRKNKIEPQPLQVEFRKEFAAREDFVSHTSKNEREHATFDRRIDGVDRSLRQHIDEKFQQQQDNAEEGRSNLHKRIDELLKAVSRVEGRLEHRGRGI